MLRGSVFSLTFTSHDLTAKCKWYFYCYHLVSLFHFLLAARYWVCVCNIWYSLRYLYKFLVLYVHRFWQNVHTMTIKTSNKIDSSLGTNRSIWNAIQWFYIEFTVFFFCFFLLLLCIMPYYTHGHLNFQPPSIA